MSEDRLSIPVDQIYVPEDYVRPLDEAAAMVLARQMEAEGQKTPIAVYKSTAREGGRKPFTLIYGRRRLWAAERLGWSTIEAVLRPKAEAPMLAVVDNLASPTLDALEQGEHVARFAECWAEMNGPISHGGDRRSRFQHETLKQRMDFLEKSSFYKALSENFGISKSTGWRLLKIGNMHPSLRSALRGTKYANDKTRLIKLIKPRPGLLEDVTSWQAGIAGALTVNPDLDAVLRMDDPVAGRKGVGRMETGDWREKRFREAWNELPGDRRAAALDGIGAMPKLVEQWPPHLPIVRAMPAPGNASPLWAMLRDPYRELSRPPTYEQAQRLKAQIEREELETARYLRTVDENINAAERARQPEFAVQREMAKAKAVRAQRKRTGLSVTLPRREAKMLGDLDDALRQKLGDVGGDRSADLVRACHKLDDVRQAEMIRMLYKGCDYALAVECAQALHYDQLSKARGVARLEIDQPKIAVRSGRYKRLLPQLVSRLFGLKIESFYSGRSVFGTLSPEQQLEICQMLDEGESIETVELEARRISPNHIIRHKLAMEMIQRQFDAEREEYRPKPLH